VARVDATETSRDELIGDQSNARRGPILDPNVDLTIVEYADELDEDLQRVLASIIETGDHSPAGTTSSDRNEVSGAILLCGEYQHGSIDPYAPINDQIGLTPSLRQSFDVLAPIKLSEESIDIGVDPLTYEEARVYLAHARTLDPTMDSDAEKLFITLSAEIEGHIQENIEEIRAYGGPIDASQVRQSIRRLAHARTRLRLVDTTSVSDVSDAENLLREIHTKLSEDLDELIFTGSVCDDFDVDDAETHSSKDQRERLGTLKEIISDLEPDSVEGVHIDVVLDRAVENGMSRRIAEAEIENLKKSGEVYEPSLDHIQTT
jgi:DNA replicative helicase MCM subunit Mcm2 (Cdc46/Mcm family)